MKSRDQHHEAPDYPRDGSTFWVVQPRLSAPSQYDMNGFIKDVTGDKDRCENKQITIQRPYVW